MKKVLFFLLLFSVYALAGIGHIMALTGEASIDRNLDKINAQMGMAILQGDKITTFEKTRIQVVLNDDTVITIGENSSFQFDKFVYDGTTNSKTEMKAQRGFFRAVTGKIGKIAPKRFTVKTSSATIGIRGTDFSAMIKKNRETYHCYSGEIIIYLKNKAPKILKSGDSMEVELSNGIVISQSISKIQNNTTSSQIDQKNNSAGDEAESGLDDLAEITQSLGQDFITEKPGTEPVIPPGEICP